MSTYNVLAIGDPHFKSDNGEATAELTAKVKSLIRDRLSEIDAVVILGDILHRHEKIDLHPFHRAMEFLEGIHDALGAPRGSFSRWLYIIIGNHDRSNNQVFMTDEHVFNPLKKWKNTVVVDKAMVHSPREDVRFLLVPYVPPGRFQEAYQTVIQDDVLESSITAVFAHQEFAGSKMGTITSAEGDPWDTLKPVCISGHIHDYQMPKANLVYTGTPIQHGFADVGRKTVSLFSLEKSKFKESRIDLKIKGRITVKGNVIDFDMTKIPVGDFYVKMKLTGTKRQIKTFKDSKIYSEAIIRGVIFQFLEVPTVDLAAEASAGSELLKSIHGGKTFSERLEDLRESLDPLVKKEFDILFGSGQ